MVTTCIYCQLDSAGNHNGNCPAKNVVNPIVNTSTNTTSPMKTHYKHRSFKITKNKFSLGSIERHESEKGIDDKRFEIKEEFKFTGYTINLFIFEYRFGGKVYIDYTA